MFDKEDFGVKINTILWFDVVPAKSSLSALHEGYPDLQVEIWTLNGKFS